MSGSNDLLGLVVRRGHAALASAVGVGSVEEAIRGRSGFWPASPVEVFGGCLGVDGTLVKVDQKGAFFFQWFGADNNCGVHAVDWRSRPAVGLIS